MSGPNTDNIKRWLEQSDIDYFSHFVKAWIPFNAWYRNTYPGLTKERDILDQVKSDGNRIRSRFMAKFGGTDSESREIQSHIAMLHHRLSVDPLCDRKGHKISFDNICVGMNPVPKHQGKHHSWTYSVERTRTPASVISSVLNKINVQVFSLTQPEWDIDALQRDPSFTSSLSAQKRVILLDYYKRAHPLEFVSLLASSDAPDRDKFVMDAYSFVGDRSKLFAGLIEMLYSLRNLLFHGELVPDPEANRTYEPAYHLLRHLIRCIT